MLDLDSYMGIHAQALQLRSQRSELIARNLANSDTPNYKAQDLDFGAALAQANGTGGSLSLTTTRADHLATPGNTAGMTGPAAAGALRYRTPLAPSLDGNTVDVQVEQGAFAENALRFQATLSFLNSRLRGLMTAITGQ